MPGTFHYIRRHLFLNKCQTSHFTLLAVTLTYGIFNSSFLLLLYMIARELYVGYTVFLNYITATLATVYTEMIKGNIYMEPRFSFKLRRTI